jgi:hypothetical protein
VWRLQEAGPDAGRDAGAPGDDGHAGYLGMRHDEAGHDQGDEAGAVERIAGTDALTVRVYQVASGGGAAPGAPSRELQASTGRRHDRSAEGAADGPVGQAR